MANNITWDTSDFENKATALLQRAKANTLKAVNDVATKVLALSALEVPIGTREGEGGQAGTLQNSGHVNQAEDQNDPVAVVGYNTVYAAYQHEGHRFDGTHVITHHTNPRGKTKYLEDPIKNNMQVFRSYFSKLLR